jgi:hypothetical protein
MLLAAILVFVAVERYGAREAEVKEINSHQVLNRQTLQLEGGVTMTMPVSTTYASLFAVVFGVAGIGFVYKGSPE